MPSTTTLNCHSGTIFYCKSTFTREKFKHKSVTIDECCCSEYIVYASRLGFELLECRKGRPSSVGG